MNRPVAVPARAGVGLKLEHCEALLAAAGGEDAPVGWVEIHAENYMGAGGPPHHWLARIRERYPLSLHGVGLSIGAAGPLDRAHLARLRAVADRYAPGLFSEHLAWSTHAGTYLADLLPLPYTGATLARVAEHVEEVQEAMGRRMLLENPSRYLEFETETMAETEFLREIVRRTGCGLLLDVNNVHVSAVNRGTSAAAYLADFPLEAVGEIHLAGHAPDRDADGAPLLIDAHDRPVADPVWALYASVIRRTGPLPTLIEWDTDVPPFEVLAAEAARADRVMAEAARADRVTAEAAGAAAPARAHG